MVDDDSPTADPTPRRKAPDIDAARFPSIDSPLCSIVVLAWRLEHPLLECLASVAASVDAPPFEVVVVLNGATEGVRATVAQSVQGVTVVDLPHNVGFGGGCNAGVDVARGERIVFLNDDTVVQPGWLAALSRAADERGPGDAVASVLLDPDGRVQEAGSRVLPDATTTAIGRGLTVEEAEAEGLLTPRAIDYGSAAALLVGTDAFRSIGGFDPVFEPAYYEDVDLQFRLKLAGGQVVLAPEARVAHALGGSTSAQPIFQRWADRKNSAIFIDRWSAVLAGAPHRTDPIDRLCAIPVDAGSALNSRPLPPASQIAENALAIAFSVSQGYASWLADRVSGASEELQIERDLVRDVSLTNQALDARVTELTTEVQEITAERDLLAARLHDLDHRGLIGIARWKAGVISNRRQEKRSGSE